MKRKLNIFVYIILALIIFQNIFFGITFADEEAECYVCSRMSNEMQMYVNFQVEMIWALSQVHKDREIYSWLTKRWLFSYWTFSAGSMFLNSLKNSINKTTQSALDATRSIEYSTFIVAKNAWTIAFSAEWLWDMLVLFRQEPFMRDWNTLQEIDGSIDDLLWDVGMQWMLSKSVSSEILAQVNEIAQKYTEADSVFSKFQVDWNVSYGKFILMLNDVNRLMKNFFTTESISVYKKNVNMFEKEVKKWKSVVVISFNHDYLTKLSESYACVKGVKWYKNCGGSLTSFASDVKHIGSDVSVEFKNARKQIKDSSKKLAEASKSVGKVMKAKYVDGWDLGLTDDQVELLRDVYGINTEKLTKQQWLSLSSIINWTAWKNIKNSVSISQDVIEGKIKSQKKESEKIMNEETTNDSITKEKFKKMSSYTKKKSCMKRLNRVWVSSTWANKTRQETCLTELWSDSFLLKEDVTSYVEFYIPDGRIHDFTGMIEYLNNSIDDTLAELDLDKAVVMYSQNLDTTRYFVEIWAYIHGMVENIIWSKNGASDTIVNNLGKACEAQCSNKWWRCYN